MLQLKYSRDEPSILVPGTLEALDQLVKYGIMDKPCSQLLAINYRWLRRVESGLRLMNLAARHELPSSIEDLDRLQFLLQNANRSDWPDDHSPIGSHHPIVDLCTTVRDRNRHTFNAIFTRHG